jgi:hypothetical protein
MFRLLREVIILCCYVFLTSKQDIIEASPFRVLPHKLLFTIPVPVPSLLHSQGLTVTISVSVRG